MYMLGAPQQEAGGRTDQAAALWCLWLGGREPLCPQGAPVLLMHGGCAAADGVAGSLKPARLHGHHFEAACCALPPR
jgi:hypothetical protein